LNLAGSWLSSSAAGPVIRFQTFLLWFLLCKCRGVLPLLSKSIEKQVVGKKVAGPASSGCTFDLKKTTTTTATKTLESLSL